MDCCDSWILQHIHLPLAFAYEVLDELVTLAINMAIPAWQANISQPERLAGDQGTACWPGACLSNSCLV